MDCTGSKKSFKVAEALEKKGLINDAANYYLESLQRKPSNIDARVKLQNIGQKHVYNMASDFFRNLTTQQTESSLEIFEKLKDFTSKAAALNVALDYPKSYEDDYQKTIETYCAKNYAQAYAMVNQKKYSYALNYISNIKKYNQNYKTTPQLEITAYCEPFYQSAMLYMETKNYANALIPLSQIKTKTENYKDFKELYDLAISEQTKYFILIEPKISAYSKEKEIEEYLFNNFTQLAAQKFTSINLINNTAFGCSTIKNDLFTSSNSIDVIEAIRKATGTDFFYTYEVLNKKELNNNPIVKSYTAYEQVTTVKNLNQIVTEYFPVNYHLVKGSRSYSYDFKYKIINAFSNQIVSSQTQNISNEDAIEYNELQKKISGNINSLYPYNPQQTAPAAQYDPRNWRTLFTAKNTLKSFDELKSETNNRTIDYFISTVTNYIK